MRQEKQEKNRSEDAVVKLVCSVTLLLFPLNVSKMGVSYTKTISVYSVSYKVLLTLVSWKKH